MNRRRWRILCALVPLAMTPLCFAADLQAAAVGIPVTLAEAVRAGLASRIQMDIANAEISKAQGALAEARSGYWPELGLEANTAKTESEDDFTGIQASANVAGNPVVVNVTRTVPAFTSSAALKANLNLYSGGLTRARVSEARGGVTTAIAEREQRRREIVVDIIRGYWAVKQAQLRSALGAESTALAQREMALAETRLALGKGSSLALQEKKLSLLQKRVDQKKADLDLSDAYRRYLSALGRDAVSAPMGTHPGPLLTDNPDNLDVQALLTPYVMDQAPELLKAQASLRMAQARRRAARSEYFAKVDLYARYQDVGRDDEDLSGSFDDWHHAETAVGLGVTWKLFNGGQTRHRVAQAADEVSRATLALEQVHRDYAAASDDRNNTIERLVQDADLAQQQLSISVEKENIARDGVEAGRVSRIDYDAAKLATREADTRLQSAKIDLLSARMEQVLYSVRVEASLPQ